jgi:hypothetical protein
MVIAIFDAAMGVTSGMILYHTVPVFKYSLEMGHGSNGLGAESDMGVGRIGSTGRISVR